MTSQGARALLRSSQLSHFLYEVVETARLEGRTNPTSAGPFPGSVPLRSSILAYLGLCKPRTNKTSQQHNTTMKGTSDQRSTPYPTFISTAEPDCQHSRLKPSVECSFSRQTRLLNDEDFYKLLEFGIFIFLAENLRTVYMSYKLQLKSR